MTTETHTGRYPSLAGRSIFMTGGATGIGAAMVRAFSDQGANVAFVDIAHAAGDALVADLAHGEGTVMFLPCDVTEVESLQYAATAASERHGPPTVLINNAANDTRHDWRSVTPDSWDQAMALNLRAMFFAIQAIAPRMIAREAGGSIINFGSISWKTKHSGMPAYTTAKAAVHGLTRSFTQELGPHRIRVNSLIPGWVLTERQRKLHFDEAGAQSLHDNQALPGTVSASDVAAAALFLAADDSAMITGQELVVDGGWT